jgi:murein DD-endopeptidase MepM/ murein hydrolase activator NlpD
MRLPRRIGASVLLLLLASVMAPEASVGGKDVPNQVVASEVNGPPATDGLMLFGVPRQGAALRGAVAPDAMALTFNGEPVAFDTSGAFLIGIDRDAALDAQLAVTLADGRRIERGLAIAPGNWRIERVNAPYTGAVGSAEFQRRRAGELEQIAAARRLGAHSDGWRQDFIWPLRGRLAGRFGSQRIFQGKPGAYHSGIDIAAATGTPFVAPADGVVTLVAETPFTLEGNLLIVDHGMGLTSAFLHASRLDVDVGQIVRQGQVLGAVGATGRATGPHLHWGLRWRSARLDPLPLLPD